MQACLYGHWEVVQTLVLFRANIHKADYLNGGTALHFAALNGHSCCIRLLLADYVPSIPDFWDIIMKRSAQEDSTINFDKGSLDRILNKPADGGITALHMAALNGHFDTVQLLLDLGACVSKVTVKDGTTIDLIGAGSTPLHYAACGGNAQCCQVLISRGASLTAKNANGWTPSMVARSWHRNCLNRILNNNNPEGHLNILPSPYISLPLMSIVKIARECGWRDGDPLPTCVDPCAVCLEMKCTVTAEGCRHEFCTRCALYLCSTNSRSTAGPPGSIACPLCRHGIVSFVKLPGTNPIKEMARMNLSLPSCTPYHSEGPEPASVSTPFCKPEFSCTRITPLSASSFWSLSCQKFPSMKLNSSLCIGAPDTSPSLVTCVSDRRTNSLLGRCSRSSLRRSASHGERRSWFPFNSCAATSNG
ncbi:probable E3 ubiquitin-protein ligase XBOS32 isoform X2 [Magnolia sinica]|nr:probable E3 ubiquitin-protein ligase XBOS32 isoform X2 [Magnolia sinica]XP_058113910.1 probable E3 ubiquitin-protein ligase XBOS32 isoform X2 [Magnolia sinica]XP_058113911.1 probable E3 ubiquitin-protein ligase XBOS32 isoform X2 [Magnolia sinica]